MTVTMINVANAIPTSSSDALLTYSLLTQPDPLQVKGAGILTLVVSKSTRGIITCTQIKVTLLEGKSGDTLTPDLSGIETEIPSSSWRADPAGGVITLTPTGDAGTFGPAGISFVFSGFAVNSEPGTTVVKIDEIASSDSQSSQTRTATFLVPKLPTQFQLSDLTLIDPATPDIPYDGSATLMWTGTGDQVSYSLEYQPADDGPEMSPPIGSTGPYTADNLTRTGSITFTLTAKVTVPGLDYPLIVTRQLTVQIETPRLEAVMQPLSVPPNGLARLKWHASNVVSCTLDPGGVALKNSGVLLFLIPATPATHLFSITATPAKGDPIVQQFTITVDPTILPNQPAIELTGHQGPPGPPGQNAQMGEFYMPPQPGGPGGRGLDATLTKTVPALDVTSQPARVVPIIVTGGKGGTGGRGGTSLAIGGIGGPGGDAILELTLDPTLQPAAQYIITLVPGPKGDGGPGGFAAMGGQQEGPQGPPGQPGSTSMSIKEVGGEHGNND